MYKPIIVLGMHKSGTTLVAEMLHHSGIKMIEEENDAGYDEGNQYERRSTNLLNKKLLNCFGVKSIYSRKELNINSVDGNLWIDGISIISELEFNNNFWGFKEPRTLLTFDFWRKIIPNFKVICVYRDPVSVHSHYTKGRSVLSKRGLGALRAFAAYNEKLLKVLENTAIETIAVEYNALMDGNDQISRIEEFIGRKLVDRRNVSLNRSKRRPSIAYKRDILLAKYFFGVDIRSLYSDLCKHRAN